MLLEKEAKLISALRTMGLPLHLYFLSYWIVYGAPRHSRDIAERQDIAETQPRYSRETSRDTAETPPSSHRLSGRRCGSASSAPRLHLGCTSGVCWAGAMYVLGGAIMTAAYALCGFFPNSDLFLLFLTTVFNVPATLAFMSCVVGKCSKQAAVGREGRGEEERRGRGEERRGSGGGVRSATRPGHVLDTQAGQTLAFFGSWVFIGLFILFERTGVPSAAWYPLCIFPMFAGPAGGYRFYELEATGEGLTWAELTSSGSGPRC